MSKQNFTLAMLAAGLGLSSTLLPSSSLAHSDLDRQFALDTIGCLRSWDNMDGVFVDYALAACRDYFSRQSRFILQDLSKADSILTGSKLPYNKVIDDKEVLAQLARVSRSQSLIRTKIQKEGPQYRFTLAWLHSPRMDLLASDEFILKENETTKGFSQDELRERLRSSLDRMIRKIPFLGTVTGRDQKAVVVNIGKNAGINPGDTLVIGTLDEVKRHPLLKEIVDWRLSTTGKVVVEQVEDGLAFCQLQEEEPHRQVSRLQKIIQIQSKPALKEPEAVRDSKPVPIDSEWKPTLGWVGALGSLGSFSRQFSNSSAIAKSGGGIALGAQTQGQLWLTREWFAEAALGYGFWRYSQKDTSTGTETTADISGTYNHLKLAMGYSYLVNGDLFGPRGWVKAGYHSINYALPILSSELLAPSSFHSIYVGIGGDLPLRAGWGALIDLEFGIFPGGSETQGSSGDVQSASDVSFFLGGYYRWSPRIVIRGGLQVLANNANFATSSLSQKVVTLAPTLVYYF